MEPKNNWNKQLRIKQTENVIALKNAYFEWFNTIDWNIEITLSRNQDWSREEAVRAANMFGQRLDEATFGNSRHRYGKSLERWLTIEYASPYGRRLTTNDIKYASQDDDYAGWHLHGFLKIPDDKRLSYIQLKKIIEDCWLKTNRHLYGKKNHKAKMEIGPLYDRTTWFNYCTKQCNKTGDVFLLNASHINTPPV